MAILTPDPASRWGGFLHRRGAAIALANLAAQVGIIVTGGAVRLTASGLGCATWPECQPGSFTPVRHAAMGYHQLIEFGNRTLSGVVLVTTLLCLLVGLAATGRSRGYRTLAAMPILLVIAQIVVGGVTVLAHLHPGVVGVHMLISLGLVAVSTLFWTATKLGAFRTPLNAATAAGMSAVRWLRWLLAAAAAVLLCFGVVVTGAGPHSGDDDRPYRLPVDPQMWSWLHADVALVYCGVLVATALVAIVTGFSARTRAWAVAAVAVALSQGTVGYVQYFTKLPIVLVAVHMLGAALVTLTVTGLIRALSDDAAPVAAVAPHVSKTAV